MLMNKLRWQRRNYKLARKEYTMHPPRPQICDPWRRLPDLKTKQVPDDVKLQPWQIKFQYNKITGIFIKFPKLLFIPLIMLENCNLPYNSQHNLNEQSSWSGRSSWSIGELRPELTQHDTQVCGFCYRMTVPPQPGEGRWNAMHIPGGSHQYK